MEMIYRQEAAALRAELARREAPAPLPSLAFYANDIDDFIRVVDERGIHPTEVQDVVQRLRALIGENDQLRQELREAQTYRDNAAAEELADLRLDLDNAQTRIYDLEIQLHDLRRVKK